MRQWKFTKVKGLAEDQRANQTEARTQVFGPEVLGFLCDSTSGSLAKHTHSKRGCQELALKEARDSVLLSWKLLLKRICKLWTCDIIVTDVPKRVPNQSLIGAMTNVLLVLRASSTHISSWQPHRGMANAYLLPLGSHKHSGGVGLGWVGFDAAWTEVNR